MSRTEKFRRVGLARALSKLGRCSRTQASEWIRAGRVRLNDRIARDPETPVRMESDRIRVDGEAVQAVPHIYWMMNKPRNVITGFDQMGRATVWAYLPEGIPFVVPVGRLDKASEGLLLFTNDSEWGARVTAPETHLDKTYHVQVAGKMTPAAMHAMTRGVRTGEADILRAKSVDILRRGPKNTWLRVVLDEGRNRQIRRMLEGLQIEVLRLVRVAIGPLALGEVAKGTSRMLTNQEKEALDRAMAKAEVGNRRFEGANTKLAGWKPGLRNTPRGSA